MDNSLETQTQRFSQVSAKPYQNFGTKLLLCSCRSLEHLLCLFEQLKGNDKL